MLVRSYFLVLLAFFALVIDFVLVLVFLVAILAVFVLVAVDFLVALAFILGIFFALAVVVRATGLNMRNLRKVKYVAKLPAKISSMTMTKACERMTSAKSSVKRLATASLMTPVFGTKATSPNGAR